MGWFEKKDEKKERNLPELPELPKLPDLSTIKELSEPVKIVPQLPTFPNSAIGQKFSQNTIKDAVSGRKEVNEGSDADESEGEEQMMPEPEFRQFPSFTKDFKTKEFESYSSPLKSSFRNEKSGEPIFVRIDKYEENLFNIGTIQKQMNDIERTLEHIKRIKEQENAEILTWEKEIKSAKEKVEKINRDIFSKLG